MRTVSTLLEHFLKATNLNLKDNGCNSVTMWHVGRLGPGSLIDDIAVLVVLVVYFYYYYFYFYFYLFYIYFIL